KKNNIKCLVMLRSHWPALLHQCRGLPARAHIWHYPSPTRVVRDPFRRHSRIHATDAKERARPAARAGGFVLSRPAPRGGERDAPEAVLEPLRRRALVGAVGARELRDLGGVPRRYAPLPDADPPMAHHGLPL